MLQAPCQGNVLRRCRAVPFTSPSAPVRVAYGAPSSVSMQPKPVCVPCRSFGSSSSSSSLRTSQPASCRSRKQVVARASWGAPVEFSSGRVLQNKAVAPGLHQLLVDVGTSTASGYTKPGQYIQAKVGADSKAGFFAIASAPDKNNAGVLELLIKSQPGSPAEALCGLQAGAELLVSPVQGKGYSTENIPAADVSTVLLFATGSGISPIKAVIESGVLEVGSRKEVRLYYGTRSPEATAYRDLLPVWKALGVNVVQVHSSSDKKYVQDVFSGDVEHVVPAATSGSTAALLCGHKEMVNSIKGLLKAQGVPEERMLLNF